MKIIKQGQIPVTPPPWWVGKQCICPSCRTEFELEEKDEKLLIIISNRGLLSSSSTIQLRCPFCSKGCTFKTTPDRTGLVSC